MQRVKVDPAEFWNELADSENTQPSWADIFTSSQEFFPSNNVRTPDRHVPYPRQRTESRPNTFMSSSSLFAPPSPSFFPLHSTNNEYPWAPEPVMSPRSTWNLGNESPPSPFIPPDSPLSTNYYEFNDEDKLDSLISNPKQTTQPPSQSDERSTPPWILASRELHPPKKPVDFQFIAYMADLRRQIHGTSSTSSTPQSSLLLGTPISIASTAFSPSSSIASPPQAVEFPPTPVFTDDIPEEFMRKVESSLFVGQAPLLRNSHPLQNSDPQGSNSNHIPVTATTASSTATTSNTNPTSMTTPASYHPPPAPDPAAVARHGSWNRRGDHLSPTGYIGYFDEPPESNYKEHYNQNTAVFRPVVHVTSNGW